MAGLTVDHLREAGVLVAHLQRSMLSGTRDLAQVPGTIKRVIADEMWRERTDPQSGRRYGPFSSFEEFVATPARLGGLGSTISQLLGLCEDDPAARDAIDAALGHSQGKRTDLNLGNNVPEVGRPEGNTEAKALRRLRKYRPDLHERVLAGELSAHAAMIDAGFRPHTFTVRADDPASTARTLRKHMSPEDLARLAALLWDHET